MSGWFLVHRGWMQSPDFQAEPYTEREAFLWSIEQAAFEPHLQWFNRVQYPVGRGEFVTSIRKMAAAFKWGEGRVRGFIARMERCEKWTLRGTQAATHTPRVLTVCNYEHFQTVGKRANAAGSAANDTAATQLEHSHNTQQKEGINNDNEGERKELEAAPPARAPVLPYETAVDAWSQIAAIKGWTPVRPKLPLSDKRRSQFGKTLKAHGLDGWIAGLQRAADSEWLGGPDPPAWFNFTFAINPENFVKILEGNYDRSFSTSNRPAASGINPWLDARRDLQAQAG